MADFAAGLISTLQYLLPGFLAAWIFYGLTSHARPAQFERIIQALILTVLISALTIIEKYALDHFSELNIQWSTDSNLMLSITTALVFGLILSYAANHDTFHRLVRYLNITKETSYPSEWFGAFLKNVTYVVLHLNDERRVYGWIVEWPSSPDKGHFLLQDASWLADDKEIPMTGVKSILVSVKDVKWVQFMERTWEQPDGQKNP